MLTNAEFSVLGLLIMIDILLSSLLTSLYTSLADDSNFFPKNSN